MQGQIALQPYVLYGSTVLKVPGCVPPPRAFSLCNLTVSICSLNGILPRAGTRLSRAMAGEERAENWSDLVAEECLVAGVVICEELIV